MEIRNMIKAKELCEMLDVYNIAKAVFDIDDSEKRLVLCSTQSTSLKSRKTNKYWFISESAAYKLIIKSKASESDKRKAIDFYKDKGFFSEVYLAETKESGFYDALKSALDAVGLKAERQYHVSICGKSYYIDFYIKSLNVGIEYDEFEHINKVEYDKKRQAEIEGLGIRIIRVSEENNNFYNIGLILKQIL